MNKAMQEINLYQPAAKGVRGALSASSTRTTLVLVTATLAGLWGFAFWQTGRLQIAAQVVRNQQQAQAAMSAASGPQLAGLSDEDLAALLTRLEGDIYRKSCALSLLGDASKQHALGFSSRLRAFGARHIEGIWLDRIALGAKVEFVGLSGSTVSPDSVPRYLRSLAQDPALKGGQIDDFVIEIRKGKKDAGDGRLSFRAGHRGLAPLPVVDEEKS
jgi:hypothetical protein